MTEIFTPSLPSHWAKEQLQAGPHSDDMKEINELHAGIKDDLDNVHLQPSASILDKILDHAKKA